MLDSTEFIEHSPIPHKFKLETPIGSIESDSGNHYVDVLSVLIVFIIMYFIYGRKRVNNG